MGPKTSDEVVVSARDYPWSSVGKLNNGVFGGCTAVLISEHYALTAAHCLFFQRSRRFLPPESLHFILGYENQRYESHLRVLAYFVPPTYNPMKPFETLASDWALLQVAGDARPATRPLAVKREVRSIAGSNLMTAGFSGRTPYRMTADKSCQLVGRSSDHNILFEIGRASCRERGEVQGVESNVY